MPGPEASERPADTIAVPTTPTAVAAAVRGAVKVDRSGVSLRAGIVAAAPVAAMLVLGNLVGQPVAAVTMAVGAMLVGVAWRGGNASASPPRSTMGVDAVALVVAVFAGTLTGRWPWLHLAVLAVFCAVAGLATVLGRRGAIVGTQGMIAYVVFGRFPEAIGGAATLAGLVALGAAVQFATASIVASPLAYRRQRAALAAAYGQLTLLVADPERESVSAADALDAAAAVLDSPALFADPRRAAMLALVSEGRRIRLEVIVLGTMLARRARGQGLPDADRAELTEIRDRLTSELTAVVRAFSVERRDRGVLDVVTGAPEGAGDGVGDWGVALPPLGDPVLDDHVAALVGQVGAAARLARRAGEEPEGGRWRELPRPSAGSLPRIVQGVREDVDHMFASARLGHPAGRHAVRLVVVVVGMELLTQRLALPRGYWAVIAAATVLRPDWGATVTRATERIGGTTIGVLVATLIAVAIDPNGWAVTGVVAALAIFTFTVFGASFAAGVAGLTAMVVFLLHGVAPDSVTIALDRGLDTLVGGLIGFVVYLLWPTWSAAQVPRLLGELLDCQRDYLRLLLDTWVDGSAPPAEQMSRRARRARLAWADAQAAVTLARGEPAGRGGDVRPVPLLAALRRLVYAAHELRVVELGASDGQAAPIPHPQLRPLSDALLQAAGTIAGRLEGTDGLAALPPLRGIYRGTDWPPASGGPDGVRSIFDEMVDALNTAAAAGGLGDEPPAGPQRP